LLLSRVTSMLAAVDVAGEWLVWRGLGPTNHSPRAQNSTTRGWTSRAPFPFMTSFFSPPSCNGIDFSKDLQANKYDVFRSGRCCWEQGAGGTTARRRMTGSPWRHANRPCLVIPCAIGQRELPIYHYQSHCKHSKSKLPLPDDPDLRPVRADHLTVPSSSPLPRLTP
jgi:hypothetical protein